MRIPGSSRRGWPIPERHDGSDGPAVEALIELIVHERTRALVEEPDLVEQADPSRVWLLWFAIGATEAICNLVECEADAQRNSMFRQVANVIFGDQPVRSDLSPLQHDKSLVELFESAGAAAVDACMRNDAKLGYYLEALRVGSRSVR